jgi:hypothetical protein
MQRAREDTESSHIRVATVSYWTPSDVLGAFLDSIRLACQKYQESFPHARVEVAIVDNSPGGKDASRLASFAEARLGSRISFQVLSGHGNVGYGPVSIALFCGPDPI